jgi:hypothetical protein
MYHKCGRASTANTHAGGQLAASAARLSGASPTRAASASIGAAGRALFLLLSELDLGAYPQRTRRNARAPRRL